MDPGEGDALEEQAEKDFAKGFALGPFTLSEIIKKHGNEWRCFPRFVIHQAHNDKWRAIDDGRKSGHHECTIAWVKVHTCVHLLHRFELTAATGYPPVTYLHAVTLPMKGGLHVNVRERVL